MFLSRFWTLLLVIAGAAMLAVVMLAKDMVNRERKINSTSHLYSELEKLDVGFTLYARKRMDVLLAVSADADVRKYIVAAGVSDAKRDEIRPKLLNVLDKRNNELKNYKADMLLAVDKNGKVIVKVGTKGRENDFSVAGFPTVDAALRGYVRDDVWKLNSDIYLIAARPVIEGGKYVGAVIHAMSVNDRFAFKFSKTSQVAFYAGSVMAAVAKTSDKDKVFADEAAISGGLAQISSQKVYQSKGRSEPVRFNDKDQDFMAVYSKVRGEASLNDVGWVVIVPVQPEIKIASFYEEAGTQDIKNLPIGLIAAMSLFLLLLGWFWNYLEAERPVSKLYQAIKELETADVKDQLNVYKFKRSVRKIAKIFNKVMDYKLREVMSGMTSSSSASGRNIDSILGEKDALRLSSASFKFAEDTSGDIPLPPSALEPPPKNAPPGSVPGGVKPAAPAGRPLTKPQKPLSAAAIKGAAGPSEAQERIYFQQVHREFVAMKQKLGEPTDQLTFEKFEVTLKKNRDALKARYGCKSVKFNVYEKEGKVSLKAIPVK